MTGPTLSTLTAGTLTRLGVRLRVRAPDPGMLALAVGLARLYEHEDRLIATGKVDMADAFFLQPGRAPGFWPFFGYGRDQEAMEGWWEYAHKHGEELRAQWWRALLARFLVGETVERDCYQPAIAERWAR